MMTKQIDLYLQPVYEHPHLHQTLDLRLLDICAVQNLLIQLRFREDCQRHDIDDARVKPVQHIGCRSCARLAVALSSKTVKIEHIVAYSCLIEF